MPTQLRTEHTQARRSLALAGHQIRLSQSFSQMDGRLRRSPALGCRAVRNAKHSARGRRKRARERHADARLCLRSAFAAGRRKTRRLARSPRGSRRLRGEHDLPPQPSALQSRVCIAEAVQRQDLCDPDRQLTRRGATRQLGRRFGVGLDLHGLVAISRTGLGTAVGTEVTNAPPSRTHTNASVPSPTVSRHASTPSTHSPRIWLSRSSPVLTTLSAPSRHASLIRV